KAGQNRLTVRLTAGHEQITPAQVASIEKDVFTERKANRGDRGYEGRVFLRKPQYVYGWDWAPKVVSIGIMKDAYLNINHGFAVSHVYPATLEADSNRARVKFDIEFESFTAVSTADAEVKLGLYYEGREVLTLSAEVLAVPGANFVTFETDIENPHLWWPNGAGRQPLYHVQTAIVSGGKTYAGSPLKMGIRTLSINMNKVDDTRRKFNFTVNGADIFAKGANWIPSDSIYARVSPEKYETLIKEARDCNFNMLRIWGGGLYEQDLFYELCDQYGLLVWQDFMFACALYPDDYPEFRHHVINEIGYQTKRLRHHACLALWCGNNEVQYLLPKEMEANYKAGISMGLDTFNKIAPKIIQANCPTTPYWPSSPFGGTHPNDDHVGNQHYWTQGTLSQHMETRITPETYDNIVTSFVAEYGYVGPCLEESMVKYFGGQPVVRDSDIWKLHNNTWAQDTDTVAEGVRKHYADPDTLPLSDYITYAQLVQGLIYAYSLESIRFYEHSGGSLFWMYNDAWGEIGWSIVDYYLARKPAYYYVKRAFAPVKFILRLSKDEKQVQVLGVNDTPEAVDVALEYGYAAFDGTYDSHMANITLPPFSKGIVLTFDKPTRDLLQGVVFARSKESPLAILRTTEFRNYPQRKAEVLIEKVETIGADLHITLQSQGYCHAVHFSPTLVCNDEYFDMLPGEKRTIIAYNAAGPVPQTEIRALCF
ncbi:MAG: beta-mannosidase, partial [Defluviitaleaceae bacterium]|nr:beta-mannosidase [Defluviitaleaceae bacterium]